MGKNDNGNNGRTELVFVVDRSGSMGGLESDTIGGFNSMLSKQRTIAGECRVTTLLFDHRIETLHDHLDIREVNDLTSRDYWVRGSTALLDWAVVPEFLRTLVFARPRGDDQFADCTFSPSLDMSR